MLKKIDFLYYNDIALMSSIFLSCILLDNLIWYILEFCICCFERHRWNFSIHKWKSKKRNAKLEVKNKHG